LPILACIMPAIRKTLALLQLRKKKIFTYLHALKPRRGTMSVKQWNGYCRRAEQYSSSPGSRKPNQTRNWLSRRTLASSKTIFGNAVLRLVRLTVRRRGGDDARHPNRSYHSFVPLVCLKTRARERLFEHNIQEYSVIPCTLHLTWLSKPNWPFCWSENHQQEGFQSPKTRSVDSKHKKVFG